jgi:hypothetical protein
MRAMRWIIVIFLALLAGCSSAGNLGFVMRSSADPIAVLKSGTNFEELGFAEGKACRHFVLAIIPWGDSDFQTAVDDALAKSGGDALVNVTTASSLYGFIPIYNVYSFTCTRVKGTAIKFIKEERTSQEKAQE